MILMGLSMAFMTLLVVANIVAVKIIGIGPWTLSAGILAYPFTFLVTDTISEVYGRRTATRIVWLGFAFSVGMLLLVWLANIWPAAGFWEGQQAFSDTLGLLPRIVLGSMVAYLISQNQDVLTFHFLRRRTEGRHLWLRNNVSTVLSQATDTFLFVTIAFAGTMPGNVFWEIMITQYVIKLLIAAVDTPIVYALVGLVRKYERPSDNTGELTSGLNPA